MTIFGLDISQYQQDAQGNPFPLHLMKEQNYHFLTARCSVGNDADTLYDHFRNRAHFHRIPFAAYHYVSKSVPVHLQAQTASLMLGLSGIPLMVDVEEGTWGRAQCFIECCRALNLNVRALYFPEWFWEECGKPILPPSLALIASKYGLNKSGHASEVYPGDTSSGWDRYGGSSPAILQFGSRIHVDGWNGNLDGDAYKGSVAELSRSGLFKFWEL